MSDIRANINRLLTSVTEPQERFRDRYRLLARMDWREIDCFTIDTEGSDADLLAGASVVLREH